jgi:hypothetical protein
MAHGDEAIEATGDFFDWVAGLKKKGTIDSFLELVPEDVVAKGPSGTAPRGFLRSRANPLLPKKKDAQTAKAILIKNDDLSDMIKDYQTAFDQIYSKSDGRKLLRVKGRSTPGSTDRVFDMERIDVTRLRDEMGMDLTPNIEKFKAMTDDEVWDYIQALEKDRLIFFDESWLNAAGTDVAANPQLRDALAVIDHAVENFGVTRMTIGQIPEEMNPWDELHGMWDSDTRGLGIHPGLTGGEKFSEVVDSILDSESTGWYSAFRTEQAQHSIVSHEIGHVADIDRNGIFQHSADMVDILTSFLKSRTSTIGLPDEPSKWSFLQAERMEIFDAKLKAGDLEIGYITRMNPQQYNNFIYLWRFMILNEGYLIDSVGRYAASHPLELVAELVKSASTAANPSPLSVRTVDWLRNLPKDENYGVWFD